MTVSQSPKDAFQDWIHYGEKEVRDLINTTKLTHSYNKEILFTLMEVESSLYKCKFYVDLVKLEEKFDHQLFTKGREHITRTILLIKHQTIIADDLLTSRKPEESLALASWKAEREQTVVERWFRDIKKTDLESDEYIIALLEIVNNITKENK